MTAAAPTAPASRRIRRITGAAIAAVAVASLLSGCLYATIPAEPGSPELRPGGDGPVGAEQYYEQNVAWSECAGGFECARVLAPLDWEQIDERSIELSLIRTAATGPERLGSLLTNPGGPGASGVDYVRAGASQAAGTDVLAAYDLVGFDPRGVGESTAVACFDAPEMDAYLYDIPAAPRGSDAWTAELEERNEAFADACEANSDGILPYITTVQSARDMDLIRALVGDEQLNFLGYSYGTFLGATYAELFPERVGRFVLDGAIDPATSGLDVGTAQGVGFENALRSFMSWCLEGADCPFRGTVDEAMADLGALFAAVDAAPLVGSDGREVGADTLLTAIIVTLYAQASWPTLQAGLTQTLQGDATAALVLADAYNGRVGGEYEDNSTEAFRAYNCMDYPDDVTDEEQAAADALLAAEAPTIAPYWSGPDSCAPWPYPPSGTRGPIAAEGAGPIVVVGTTGDPATPYAWSEALAEQLSSGALVTNVGEGHTGYNRGNACVDDAVEGYLLRGEVPVDGACG